MLNGVPASLRSSFPTLFDSDGNPKPDAMAGADTQKQIYTRQ